MKEKFLLSAFLAGIGAYFHELATPAFLLFVLMLSDYVTGLSCAFIEGQLSSRSGILGILKKVAYLFVVGVGVSLDFVLQIAGEKLGIGTQNVYFFGLLVIVWLIINECISILENVAKLGVPIPSFLKPILARLKQSTEERGNPENKPKP